MCRETVWLLQIAKCGKNLSIFRVRSNKHTVLTALLYHIEDFCGNWSQFESLSSLTSPEMGPVVKASGTERHLRRRESSGHSPLSPI